MALKIHELVHYHRPGHVITVQSRTNTSLACKRTFYLVNLSIYFSYYIHRKKYSFNLSINDLDAQPCLNDALSIVIPLLGSHRVTD